MKDWIHRPGTNDLAIIDHVYTRNSYHLPEDMTGKLVIDVGAHIGGVTILAAERGARVVAFEPCTANFAILQANVEIAGVEELAVLNWAGVDGIGGIGMLYLDLVNTGQNSRFPEMNGLNTHLREPMALNSIGSVLQNWGRCDLLKLDCEGGEEEIIEAIVAERLWERIDAIAMETHLPSAAGQLAQLAEWYDIEALGSDEYHLRRRKQ